MTILTTLIGTTGSDGGGGCGFPPFASTPFPTTNRNVPEPGNSNVRSNVAWYGIELDSGNYNFNTLGSNTGAFLDTMIAVYDTNGNLIAYDDDSGGSGWSNLDIYGMPAGVYYIGVSMFYTNWGNNNWCAQGENPDNLDKIIFTIQSIV